MSEDARAHHVEPALSGIHLYPVKSCAGLSVISAEVGPQGLVGDRRWMFVEAEGAAIT